MSIGTEIGKHSDFGRRQRTTGARKRETNRSDKRVRETNMRDDEREYVPSQRDGGRIMRI